jgi:hypothetical protein
MTAGTERRLLARETGTWKVAQRVRGIAGGLTTLGALVGAAAVVESPQFVLLGSAFALGSTQLAGY